MTQEIPGLACALFLRRGSRVLPPAHGQANLTMNAKLFLFLMLTVEVLLCVQLAGCTPMY